MKSFVVRNALQILAVVILIAFVLRTFFISSYSVSTWSMLPNIWPGDFIVGYRTGLSRPERGQTVALRCPTAREQLCLRRVIGIPGDRIEFNESGLVINGENVGYKPVSKDLGQEYYGHRSWSIWPDAVRSSGSSRPVVIAPGHVYLLNDKRSDLDDSRVWGPVSTTYMEAKVGLVWLSLDWYENDQVKNWPRVRWTRMLRSID